MERGQSQSSRSSAMVQTSSEIPLPSPSFYSLSGLGPVAILGHRPSRRPPAGWLGGSWPFPASCAKPVVPPWDPRRPWIRSAIQSEASRHRSVGEFGWGGTPVTGQRRRPEALLRWNRNLSGRRRPKVLLMLRLPVQVQNVQAWPSDPLVQCASSGYRSQRCQKNYHRDNWLVAAKRSKRRRFLILRCRLFLASHPQPSGRVGLFTHQQGT